MINLSYSITGAREVADELDRFRLDRIQADVGAILDDMARDAAQYPPELPGQKYQRTGRLGEGWADGQSMFPHSSPTMLEALRENSVNYGPFVQGAQTQRAAFAGRWRTDEQIMADWEARVADRVEDALEKILPR